MFTAEQTKLLNDPLDMKHVVEPSGSFGPKGDYLEGWHIINEMNRIFGFDGWSYTINLTRDALEKAESKDQWQAAYTCICTLRVGEVTRQDVGFGSGFSKAIGDAIEGATKEAATDALKRAARTFGNQFGLALYDKTRVNVCATPVTPPEPITAFLAGLRTAYQSGDPAEYWTKHWPSVPQDWRPYALEQKELIKSAHGKVAMLHAG